MEATKDYISLETAKLLKNCHVNAQYCFVKDINRVCSIDLLDDEYTNFYIVFTWGEILWEYPETFFGKDLLCYDCGEKVGAPFGNDKIQIGTGRCTCSRQFENNEEASEFHAKQMIWMLQARQYKEVDLYFREHCILIDK